MSGDLARQLHSSLTPSQFEKLVYALLERMGFADIHLTGRSGDEGIDLKATWNQTQVPGLQVDLDFVLQAKRFKPAASLNPRFVRELRGTLSSGQWGLLITTARVTAQTREDGLKDPSRIVSIIDGDQLIELCKKYHVGILPEYHVDVGFLKEEEVRDVPHLIEPLKSAPGDLVSVLSNSLGEKFQRIGRTTLYKGASKTLVARWSQRYPRRSKNYWYVLSSRDLSSPKEYGVTHFAYVCGDSGTALFPTSVIENHVTDGKLPRTMEDGALRHYHIEFRDSDNGLEWILKDGIRENIQLYFHGLPKQRS